ncbi:Acetylornithine aminotransferase [Clostridium neonatale]|uniref:aspartate aminotransferase family protein n=1 Tax=Clostridium neonatale TaxID=137838 RepID=UPI00291BB393|nr:Acetylornithine aminotransferase [Clostridium neonatale]
MKLKDVKLSKEELKGLVSKYMIDTYERFDFVAETAKDMYLYDEGGDGYLDFYGGIAVNSAGNCNEKVVATIKDQVEDIIHTFNYPYTIPQALLAKLICETIGMDKIFYQSTGTEANEAMIKMARKYGVDEYGPNKYNIVTAKNGFHGRTYGSMSATGQPDNGCQIGFKPMVPGFTYAEYNNLQAFKDACTENTIAIMIEPIQGEGGVHPATQEFMQGLRKLCDEKGMLLLLDEVQTGWCRTGKTMAYMHYNVKPDIVSMAKAMGGGMPIAAICATEKVSKAFTLGSHGTTYGGNPVCCAASYAQINELIDKDLAGNAEKMGEYLKAKLKELPHIVEVRGKGLLVGVEFDQNIAVDVKHACFDRKLLITAIGGNTIRMVPPLILNEEDCDKAFEIIKESVDDVVK